VRTAFITEDLTPWDGTWHPGGCAFYRQMLPKNAAGDYSMFGKPAWSAEYGYGVNYQEGMALFGFDTVVLKQVMARWTPDQMRRAQELGQRLIVDIDDAYDHLHEANRAHKATDPSVNKIHNRNYLREVIMQADVVTVSTPFLLNYYQQQGVRDVRMIRNGIAPHMFKARKVRNRRPVVGWVGATGWRSNDMEILAGWFGDWLVEHDLMFHHSGHEDKFPAVADLARIPADRVTTSPMQDIGQYPSMFTFDIGIVPMDDIPFNHAKSNLKGLEYAASGIPFVASKTPEYQHLFDDGVGRVAGTPDEWRDQLTALLDYPTRKREAARNRHRVMQLHTIVQRAPEWAALFGESPATRIKTVRVPYVYR
jgi:hypothetical protein